MSLLKARCYAGEEDFTWIWPFPRCRPGKRVRPANRVHSCASHAPETSSHVPKYRPHEDNCRSFSRERFGSVPPTWPAAELILTHNVNGRGHSQRCAVSCVVQVFVLSGDLVACPLFCGGRNSLSYGAVVRHLRWMTPISAQTEQLSRERLR